MLRKNKVTHDEISRGSPAGWEGTTGVCISRNSKGRAVTLLLGHFVITLIEQPARRIENHNILVPVLAVASFNFKSPEIFGVFTTLYTSVPLHMVILYSGE